MGRHTHRFHIDKINLFKSNVVELSEREGNHARQVLRLKVGDDVIVFNGESQFLAKLKVVSRDSVMVEIISELESNASLNYTSHAYISLIKPSNIELIVQKLTELGVGEIHLVSSEFGQYNFNGKLPDRWRNRWENIVLEACKQSERTQIPPVIEPVKLEDALSSISNHDLRIMAVNPREIANFEDSLQPLSVLVPDISNSKSIGYLIGPEGGFSPTEVSAARKIVDMKFVSLGATILRAETAAISMQSFIHLNKSK